jgi:hypothetical protein
VPIIQRDTNVYQNLKELVDSNSLADVLAAIANICDEKAGYIRQYREDKQSATPWIAASLKLDQMAEKLSI